MDPISSINLKKDSSLAMLLAAQKRNWTLHYFETRDLYSQDGKAFGRAKTLHIDTKNNPWYTLSEEQDLALGSLDIILMRKDPPFNNDYIYATYLLEQAERQGALVVNRPQSLRDCNEKFFSTALPQCCTPVLVSQRADIIRAFAEEHKDIILKPLDGMGGRSIFRSHPNDPNLSVIIETLTDAEQTQIMVQRFIPEISDGDKRVLLINGEAVPYALARVPAKGELRGNLAAGGQGEGRELSDRDRWICEQVGPTLRERGILFAGLDIIGDYLTEINITSPTCIKELDAAFDLDIASQLMDCIERAVEAQNALHNRD